MSEHHDVIVVGSGIAGLVAAYRLARAGRSVRILEAGDQIGGRVGERETRGIRYNTGARLLYPFSRPFNALLDDLGLTGDLIPVHHLSAQCIGQDGDWLVELMPGPKSLMTPGLSLGERLRFVPYGLSMLAARARTDPDDAASAPAADAEPLDAYTRRRMGPNVLARMVEPIFRGTRAWNAEEISAAFFASTTPHLIGKSHVNVLKGGMNQLPAALAQGSQVTCNATVLAVEDPSSGPCRVTARIGEDETVLSADHVLVAVEGDRAAPLLADLPPEDRAFLDSVRYNSLGVVHYRLSGDVPARMNFFAREGAGPIATYQQLPANAAKGQAAQIYAQLSPEAARHAAETGQTGDLHPIIEDQLRQLFPGFDAQQVDRHTQWIQRKLPTFSTGYAMQAKAFRDRQDASARRVTFAGDYLQQSLVTGAAASGERAARRILGA